MFLVYSTGCVAAADIRSGCWCSGVGANHVLVGCSGKDGVMNNKDELDASKCRGEAEDEWLAEVVREKLIEDALDVQAEMNNARDELDERE